LPNLTILLADSANLNGAVSSNVVRENPLSDGSTHLLTIDPPQYRAKDSPRYTLGHGIVLIYLGLAILTSVIYWATLRAENARRDEGLRDEIIDGVNDGGNYAYLLSLTPAADWFVPVMLGEVGNVERLARLNGKFATVDEAKREKGDKWSGYRYVL
jgi:hypothetical protein